jgi:hypothetical protein
MYLFYRRPVPQISSFYFSRITEFFLEKLDIILPVAQAEAEEFTTEIISS